MSHTPGPWKLQAGRSFETSSGTFHLSYGLSKTGRPLFSNPCELDSNARLIAAAPELLRGCQAALAYLVDQPSKFEENREEAARIIIEAIRKAKGE